VLGAAGGIVGAYVMSMVMLKTADVGMICNGLIAGLVAITAPSGYVENWAAPIIGLVGGFIVVASIIAIDKKLDDPVGVLSAHGVAGIWGTLSCGLFTAPRFAEYAGIGNPDGGLFYSGSFSQLGHQALGIVVAFATVLVLTFAVFWAIKKTIGLRVSPEDEMSGLDLAEHGVYGYPEFLDTDGNLLGQPNGVTTSGGGSTASGTPLATK
jgi:ammonium transporter, Amt family